MSSESEPSDPSPFAIEMPSSPNEEGIDDTVMIEDDFQRTMLRFMQEQTKYLREMSTQLHALSTSSEHAPSTPRPPTPPPAPPLPASTGAIPIAATVAPVPTAAAPEPHTPSVPRREIDDDLGWSAVMETALRKLHEQVVSWKDGLDTTLLFIALFSAIVTAFLNQIIQNLTPAPGQDTDQLLTSLIEVIVQIASLNGLQTPVIKEPEPFQAAHSDEVSAFFWYSSLIVSILCAGLAAFARFQMLEIEEIPRGEKFIEKVMRLKDRERMAKWLLIPTFDALRWSLTLAIGLFMAGLLYQLWNLHATIMAPLLWATGILGTTLAALVAAFIIFVTVHAMFYEESPFDTSLTKNVRAFLWGKGDFSSFWTALRAIDLPDFPKWHPQYLHAVRDLFPRYSDPERPVAAHQFCDLISQCTDPKLLNRAAPVLVECFDFIDFNVARFQDNIEPAILQMLDPDTSDEAKLTVLRNITRLKKDVLTECKQLVAVLPGVLLRIQEESAERNPDIRKAAFHATIHIIDQPEQSQDPNQIAPPRSHEDCIVRGLQDCDPIHDPDRKHPVSRAFLSALLEFDYLPSTLQTSILQSIDPASFLAAYVVSIYWAYKELGVWDHRARYRRILGQSFRPKLDSIISGYERVDENDPDLITKLSPFISNLESWISPDQGERSKRAAAAMMGILRRIRLKQHDVPEHLLKLPPLKLGLLAEALLPVDVVVADIPVKPGDAPRSITTLVPKRLDLSALRHLEVLAWYIDRCEAGLALVSPKSSVLQFLIDCNELEKDDSWAQSNCFVLFGDLQEHITSALGKVDSEFRSPDIELMSVSSEK
ncbi:hypothetical protein SISSUDRAFT_133837 [Sistotremastrum suecicum HHB10207 ss-3]|uniref:DUF6535 domain-containing protein n=1 Tax=Sistotremastrum suecicum HHB10207 ss-3 TaxID=1314776 RepID=A0A166AWG7_9AGAM|nr:hypothetical protein SISSUDRAFT_133837 [Sistotremastrum suecicum HHB10207 ss-3]